MIVSEKQNVSNIFMGVFFIAAFFVELLTEVNIDFFILFIFVIFLLNLGKLSPNFIIRYIMIFFMSIGNVVGVYICENFNLRLSELDIVSFYSGSFPLIVLGWFVFLCTLFFLDSKYPLSLNSKSYPIINFKLGQIDLSVKRVVPIIFSCLTLILLVRVGGHPFFLEGIDRFIYQERYLQGIWRQIVGWASLCLPIIIYIIGKERSKFNLLGLVLYLIFLFLTGEKFGGFWNVIVTGCIIYSIYSQNYDKRILYDILIKVLIGFICLLTILLVHRSLNYDSSWQSNTNYFLQRTAQQGQLWWKTYNSEKDKPFKLNELNDEIKTYFELSDDNIKDYNHAIYKIMRLTTPPDIFDKKLESGSRYSTSTFATVYYYFKELGVIFYGIVGATCFWAIMRAFMYSVQHLYLIEMYISGRLLFDSYAALTQSEFNLLLSYKSLIYIVIFGCLFLLRMHLNKIRYIANETTK